MIVLPCARSPLTSTKSLTLSTSFHWQSLDMPRFYEIYKHGAVLNICLTFMVIDCLGAVFSIFSLILKCPSRRLRRFLGRHPTDPLILHVQNWEHLKILLELQLTFINEAPERSAYTRHRTTSSGTRNH